MPAVDGVETEADGLVPRALLEPLEHGEAGASARRLWGWKVCLAFLKPAAGGGLIGSLGVAGSGAEGEGSVVVWSAAAAGQRLRTASRAGIRKALGFEHGEVNHMHWDDTWVGGEKFLGKAKS